MEYKCTVCSYETYDKSNFSKHLKSIRHKKKELQKTNETAMAPKRLSKEPITYQCQFCSNAFSTASSLARHRKACSNKKEIEKDHGNEIEKYKLEIRHLQEMVSKLNGDVKRMNNLIINAGGVIKTSVTALAYVAKNYDGAPILKQLKDYSYIKDQDDEDDEFDLIETLVYRHQKQTLHEYLGDIIVEAYKKQDPTKQSIWNSDTSRLTYVIRELINKKPDWTVDKKGIKTTKYIITPLLEYIYEQTTDYLETTETTGDETISKLNKLVNNTKVVSEILCNINNKILANQILKYIAPHFYLSKDDLQLIE